LNNIIMYSWQQAQWQHIMQQGAKMPHALLLRGRAGTGKQDFALNVAKAVLCAQATELQHACGNCPSCNWFTEGTHPDFMLIGPEDAENADETITSAPKKKTAKKTQISVAKIRQLLDYLTLSSHQVNGYRVIIISPADMLNGASANALLKVLEEPPANTLFLLVTSQPQRLLATITSRCQAVDMALPVRAEALAWLTSQQVKNADNSLDLAGGSPLLALQMAEEGEAGASLLKNLTLGAKLDPFACAPLFLSLGMDRAIETLQKWIFDMQSYKLASSLRYHVQQANALQALAKSVNLRLLLNFQDKLIEAKKTANHPLSNEAQLENILLQYVQLFNQK
jgi:DNA polymerase III subunit delta'